MATTTIARPVSHNETPRRVGFKVTIFHCANALSNSQALDRTGVEIRCVAMPCSSMTKDVHLLRAFEAGADAVIVLVCPEGRCRYLEGNIRAGKRVAKVKKLLDEIGLGSGRLNIHHVSQDETTVQEIIDQTIADVASLGPNPAA